MVIASILVEDKEKKSCYFEKAFLLTDINMNITLEIPFFILNNIEIDFGD